MSETITDIVREMRALAAKVDMWDGDVETSYIRDYADRIGAAARNSTLLCHQACSCEILAKMETEDEKLRALVGEMADALGWCKEQADSIGAASLLPVGFPMIKLTMTMASMSRLCNALVSTAREVAK